MNATPTFTTNRWLKGHKFKPLWEGQSTFNNPLKVMWWKAPFFFRRRHLYGTIIKNIPRAVGSPVPPKWIFLSVFIEKTQPCYHVSMPLSRIWKVENQHSSTKNTCDLEDSGARNNFSLGKYTLSPLAPSMVGPIPFRTAWSNSQLEGAAILVGNGLLSNLRLSETNLIEGRQSQCYIGFIL